MRNVEGLELSAAINALEADGIQVTTLEVSSRKCVDGDERRVVRAKQTGENSAELTFAVFKTRIDVPEE